MQISTLIKSSEFSNILFIIMLLTFLLLNESLWIKYFSYYYKGKTTKIKVCCIIFILNLKLKVT